MPTPTLETPRLLLRPFAHTDAPDVFAYAKNPSVARYTTWSPHRTVADAEAFVEIVLSRTPDQFTWAILERGIPTVIGAIELGPAKNPGDLQVDYCLAEPHWNRGLMTEAARAVIAWGLETHPNTRRIVSSACRENTGSQRVMQKCGLLFEREVQTVWPKSPDPVTLCAYAMSVHSAIK